MFYRSEKEHLLYRVPMLFSRRIGSCKYVIEKQGIFSCDRIFRYPGCPLVRPLQLELETATLIRSIAAF